MKKKVPKLRQEVKVKVDIVTSDDINFIISLSVNSFLTEDKRSFCGQCRSRSDCTECEV